MKSLAGKGYERVVYLGSHVFKGLAREAALKLLELTDGGMIAVYDSPLGFRHGPKTIVNDRTLVVIFVSNHAYTRRYDLDLLEEIWRDGRHGGLLAVCGRDEGIPAGVARLLLPAMADAEDVDLADPVHCRAADVRIRGVARARAFAGQSQRLRHRQSRGAGRAHSRCRVTP